MATDDQNLDDINKLDITHFSLRFERVCRTFYAGETIRGYVDINGNAQRNLDNIILHFRGETLACWYEDGMVSKQNTIRAHKCHWKEEITLDGSSDSVVCNGNGISSFPFEVHLPESNMPSSFESKFGAIRYWVKATIQPGSVNCQQPFTVLERVNINLKKYQKEESSSSEKVLTWLCFRYGGISLSASIDRSGYCPGEAIAVSCRGNNKCNREMGGMKARFIQTIKYTSMDKKSTKECENILRAIGGNRIQRNHTRVWQNQLLWIPAVPPSNKKSEIIRVTYHIQVSMQIPNDTDLEVNIPVTIGTIPWQHGKEDHSIHENISKFEKCTDGSDCFNRSSKRFQFPMLPFIPSTCFVQHYNFRQCDKNGMTGKMKSCNDERQPLLPRNS